MTMVVALYAHNNILRSPLFCSFALFLIVSLMPFISKPDSSRDLTIFMISFIPSFKIIDVVVCKAKSEVRPDPNMFLWIAASAADVATVNSNGIKRLFCVHKLITIYAENYSHH